MFTALVVMASLMGSPSPAPVLEAQPERAQAPGVAAQVEAMKKIGWMAGDWEGEAKYDTGRGGEGAWMTIRQSEVVRMKLAGRVMLVEGTGRAKGQGGEERVVFEALATVSYDPESKQYKMRAFGPEGAVDPTFEVGEKSIVWGFTTRMGMSRYTIKVDEQGRWVEVGERSGDEGKTWKKFVEMTLEKKK